MNATSQPPHKRRVALFAVAVLLLAFAGATLATRWNDAAMRSLAMLALIFSVYCVRLSNGYARSGSATDASQRIGSNLATRLGSPLRIVSIILVPILAMSLVFLYRDAVQGYHQIWPVYLFAATAGICALCWSYLISTFFWR
jgi:hypothetical protein